MRITRAELAEFLRRPQREGGAFIAVVNQAQAATARSRLRRSDRQAAPYDRH